MKSSALPIFFLLLLFNFQQLNLGKISDKWAKLKNDNVTCRFLIPDQFTRKFFLTFLNVIHPLDYWLYKCNCTFDRVPYTGTNIPDENGNYNGFMGMIQRNEADLTFLFVRPDALPFEPGKPTPPIEVADLAIFSFKPYGEKKETRNLLSFLDLGLCVYIYLLSTCFFIAPMILAFCQSNAEQRMDAFFILKGYIRNCYKVVTLFVGQEQFDLSMASSYIMILAISVFSSILISGILLNTVGADLIVKREPPLIDSLNDLLSSNMKPIMMKKVTGYESVRTSPQGTKLNKLWQRMIKDGLDETTVDVANGRLEVNVETTDILSKLTGKALKSEIAVIAPVFNAFLLRLGGCYLKSYPELNELAKRIHVSKGLLGQGIMSSIYSNKIHVYTEKMIMYAFSTMWETGFWIAGLRTNVANVHDLFSEISFSKYNSEVISCIDGTDLIEDSTFTPFSALDLLKLFELWAFTSCFCSLVLILEVAYDRYFPKIKGFKRRADFTKLSLQFMAHRNKRQVFGHRKTWQK